MAKDKPTRNGASNSGASMLAFLYGLTPDEIEIIEDTESQMSAQETIQAMVQRLASAMHPDQIILFGSYAWGQPTTDSDIDLCLVFNKLSGNRRDLSIKAMGIVADLRFPKDILVKTHADFEYYLPALASLESQIQRKGKILYDATKQAV